MPDDGRAHQVGETHEEQLSHLRMLLDVSRKVAAQDTLDTVLETLIDLACHETGSERGTLFLNDPATGELFSRVALGLKRREIRLMNDQGIAGAVFQSGEGEIIRNAYGDPRFNKPVDLDSVKWAALAGTVGWFAFTPLWMSREVPIDAAEVEI